MLRQFNLRFLLIVAAFGLGLYMSRGGVLFSHSAPEFSLPGVYGGRVDLDSYRGRPVLLVFWTSSCPICQHELPLVSQLAPIYRSKDVSVLAIHLGGEDDAAQFLSNYNVNLTTAFDSEGKVGRAYDVSGVPKFVLVGRDGKIRRSASGWTNERVLRSWMDAAGGS